MLFTKEQAVRLEELYDLYTGETYYAYSVSKRKKKIEEHIRLVISNAPSSIMIQNILRIFFNNYPMLKELIYSKYVTPRVISVCSKCLHEDITGIDRILELHRDNERVLTSWIRSDEKSRRIIEKYNIESDTALEAIGLLSEAKVDIGYYVSKYKDPMALKRAATILTKYPKFNVDVYNRYQLDSLLRNGLNKKLMDIVDPKYSAELIFIMGKLLKHHPTKEIISVIEKYNHNIDIIQNYFKVKEILWEIADNRIISIKVAEFINTTMLVDIAECPVEWSDRIAEYLYKISLQKGNHYDPVTSINKSIEKLETFFPFMPNMAKQLIALEPELTRLWDLELDRRSLVKQELREKKVAKARKDRMEKILPPAKIVVQDYINAARENKTLSAVQYAADNDLDKGIFTKYVEVLKEAEDPIYEEYSVISKANKDRALRSMLMAAKAVTKGLGTKFAKFSLYDYYTATKFDMATIHRVIAQNDKIFDPADLLRFKNFWEKHRWDTEMKPAYFYADRMIIGGKEITREDKDKVLGYMNKNRYPLMIPLYKKILRDYVSGDIKIY